MPPRTSGAALTIVNRIPRTLPNAPSSEVGVRLEGAGAGRARPPSEARQENDDRADDERADDGHGRDGDQPRMRSHSGAVAAAAAASAAVGHEACSRSAVMLFVVVGADLAAGGHEQSDLLLVGLARVDDGDELAAVHDADAVGQLEHLVELGRDEEDRRAGSPALDRLASG